MLVCYRAGQFKRLCCNRYYVWVSCKKHSILPSNINVGHRLDAYCHDTFHNLMTRGLSPHRLKVGGVDKQKRSQCFNDE